MANSHFGSSAKPYAPGYSLFQANSARAGRLRDSYRGKTARSQASRGLSRETPDRHHESRTSDMACLGSKNFSWAPPEWMGIHPGEVRSCNWPARSSSAYCSGEGDCGDPIFFQAEKALLCVESMRKCSTRTCSTVRERPATVSSMGAAGAGR